jgi:Rrf2 family transcriptional regulator, iron-sulfur cluster assembly transcription factor
MQLSTRGRYAVIAMLKLYEVLQRQAVVPISLIAEQENISMIYLEQLFSKLKAANLVKSMRGKNGGYLLARPAAEINMAQIVLAVEHNLFFTQCNPSTHIRCATKSGSICKTHNLWHSLTQNMLEFLSKISLYELANPKDEQVLNHYLGVASA